MWPEEITKLMDNFKNHEVVVVVNTHELQAFRCQEPGTWFYGFHVVCYGGIICLSGDIYELILKPGYPALRWLRGSANDESYVLSKVPPNIKTTRYEKTYAIKIIKQMFNEYIEEDNFKCSQQLIKVVENLYYAEESGDRGEQQFYEAYYDATGDSEMPTVTQTDYQVQFQLAALRWFCNKLDEMDFKIAKKKKSWFELLGFG